MHHFKSCTGLLLSLLGVEIGSFFNKMMMLTLCGCRCLMIKEKAHNILWQCDYL